MSYKVWVTTDGESFATNGLAFATKEEANSWGFGLLMRWTASRDYEVRESDEPVNYRCENGRAVPLDPPSGGAS